MHAGGMFRNVNREIKRARDDAEEDVAAMNRVLPDRGRGGGVKGDVGGKEACSSRGEVCSSARPRDRLQDTLYPGV